MRGFSLVELSIVLVILGLLTGGILAGQSLIRASELRSVTAEYQRYLSATHTFRDKYFAIPGDFNGAVRFWGRQVAVASCPTNSTTVAATPGACDGNGDGMISTVGGAGLSSELFQYWRQLTLAGLIEGNYSGLAGSGGSLHTTGGANTPTSKFTNGVWFNGNAVNYAGDAFAYRTDYGNFLFIGGPVLNDAPTAGFMKPEEAWNIDTKLDDGKPAYGKVIARHWNNACATGGATFSDLSTSIYNLTNSANACALYFTRQF